MTPEELAAVDAAVLSVAELLKSVPAEWRSSTRDDLRQELLLKLWQKKVRKPEGLRAAAKNWLSNRIRDERVLHETERLASRGASSNRWRDKNCWEPKSYPPHEEAREGDWLACEGARVMHLKPTISAVDPERGIILTLESTHQ